MQAELAPVLPSQLGGAICFALCKNRPSQTQDLESTGWGLHDSRANGKHGMVQGIDNKRTRELSEEELTQLREEVDKYSIEGDLRRFNNLNIKRLQDIGCRRGRRHTAVSPVFTDPASPEYVGPVPVAVLVAG